MILENHFLKTAILWEKEIISDVLDSKTKMSGQIRQNVVFKVGVHMLV